jgi:hypothetical protein
MFRFCRCAMGAGGRGSAHAFVWGLLCCTVRCVGPCRVEGRSWAWRGVLCLCAVGAGGDAVRLVWGVLCCTVRCVGPCQEKGRSWALRGVLCLCVYARGRDLELGGNQISGSFPSVVSGLSSLT